MYLGKSDQRIALDCVERWEHLHAAPQGPPEKRSEVVDLRSRSTRRPQASAAPVPLAGSLREQWKAMKGA
jgi:hypothetical protein